MELRGTDTMLALRLAKISVWFRFENHHLDGESNYLNQVGIMKKTKRWLGKEEASGFLQGAFQEAN